MDQKIVQEVLDELFPYFEAVETQSAAVMQFLKVKGMASEEELAPYVKRAENASSVRWRAARARISYLLSAAGEAREKVEEKQPEAKPHGHEKEKAEAAQPTAKDNKKKDSKKDHADPKPNANEEDQKSKEKDAAR